MQVIVFYELDEAGNKVADEDGVVERRLEIPGGEGDLSCFRDIVLENLQGDEELEDDEQPEARLIDVLEDGREVVDD